MFVGLVVGMWWILVFVVVFLVYFVLIFVLFLVIDFFCLDDDVFSKYKYFVLMWRMFDLMLFLYVCVIVLVIIYLWWRRIILFVVKMIKFIIFIDYCMFFIIVVLIVIIMNIVLRIYIFIVCELFLVVDIKGLFVIKINFFLFWV